jgi:hypothetical protein
MFADDLMIIDRLRSEAVNVQEPHISGISRLVTYAAQLKWLGGKFPIDVRYSMSLLIWFLRVVWLTGFLCYRLGSTFRGIPHWGSIQHDLVSSSLMVVGVVLSSLKYMLTGDVI